MALLTANPRTGQTAARLESGLRVSSTAGPFDVQTSSALTPSSSVPTGVAAGWPAYLLAIPFYSGCSIEKKVSRELD
ncbi:MAG TPA: hypothetical protein VK574_04955 [Terracidiphilus sp.]|nr:hypothetical protein [Terracidiphilus sp.]